MASKTDAIINKISPIGGKKYQLKINNPTDDEKQSNTPKKKVNSADDEKKENTNNNTVS